MLGVRLRFAAGKRAQPCFGAWIAGARKHNVDVRRVLRAAVLLPLLRQKAGLRASGGGPQHAVVQRAQLAPSASAW